MNLCRRYESSAGWTRVILRGENDLRFLSFGVLRLAENGVYAGNSGDEELGLVVLGGKCRIAIGGSLEADLGERENVFDGYASAAYIPPHTDYAVEARGNVEAAVGGAPSDASNAPAIVRPEDVRVRHVGKGNWARTVTDVLGDNVSAQRLIVGETYNPPGNWSSSPPHRHDNDNPPVESDMEEVYFFRLKPSQGFGFQRVYDEERALDDVYTIHHDVVVSIPYGYHPVVAAPGYELYYLWMLAGDKRLLIPYDDPYHAWVKNA